MNSFPSSFITFGWLCFLLLGWAGNGSNTFAIAQTTDDTSGVTEAIQVPINTDRSLIVWKGTKIGGKHEGTIILQEGHISFRNNIVTGGRFVVDMNTIAVTDIPEHEPVPRKRLINHLKSEDFFYVEKYPTAVFKITDVKPLEGSTIRIWGDLSIRDVTKPISFMASQLSNHKSEPEFRAHFTINRFDWNVAYQGSYWERLSSIIDNNLVHDDIQLTIILLPDISGSSFYSKAIAFTGCPDF